MACRVAMGSAIADWLRVGAVAPIMAQVEPGLDRVHEWIEATEAHAPA